MGGPVREATTRLLPGGDTREAPSTPAEPKGLFYEPYLLAGGSGSWSPGFATPGWVGAAAALLDGLDPFGDPGGQVEALWRVGRSTAGLTRRYRLAVAPGKIRVASTVTGSEKGRLGPPRGEVVRWSPKSRLRMVETMASLDWGPVVVPGPGRRPAMVTLTLPGDWLAVAPTARAFKRLMHRFWCRWERAWGPVQCVWKLEFQRRGAPHLHIYCAVPVGLAFREWLSRTWFEVVGSGDERHLRAGTGIDWGEGIRASDPKRLAIYFLKRATGHNLGVDKEYQHIVPEAWRADGPGRFWGYKGLVKAEVEVHIDEAQFVQLRRLLRRWAKSQGRPVRALSSGRGLGGMVLANSAPTLLAQASRWEVLRRKGLHDGSVEASTEGPDSATACARERGPIAALAGRVGTEVAR
jgi:hypothetical protein